MAAWWILPYANCRPPPPPTAATGARPKRRSSTSIPDTTTAPSRSMKHSVPSYFAVDIPTLPREYWEALFPRPYWPDLKRFSVANGLDPYLVASLIRQESEFNPLAVSRANAVGLMQLLPKTGKVVAHQVELKRYNPTPVIYPGREPATGHALFPRHGRQVRRIVRARSRRLQRRFRPRRGMDGARPVSRFARSSSSRSHSPRRASTFRPSCATPPSTNNSTARRRKSFRHGFTRINTDETIPIPRMRD